MSRSGLTIHVIRPSKFSCGRQQQTCLFCSAGGRKRQRRKLPLAATKKDKIRSLEKKPEPTLPSMDDLKDIDFNKVGDTVESRLTQAQEWVYKFWRDDGTSAGPRPERSTLNMNGQWWFWNILLMAAPGISIALYCEFKAKPEMHHLLGKLDEEQRARILGETLQGEEEELAEIDNDVQRIQESINVDVANADSDEDENLSLLALKQRLDALESQLYKKDKQLDHLRRYQLERTQQSGVQNRIEDKMIAEWKTQGTVPAKHDEETTTEDDVSLSERMKEAIMHGLGENLEAKKEALQTYGETCLEYGRNLFSGKQKQPEEAKESAADVGGTDNKANDDIDKSVSDAASHANRAADIVSASASSTDLNEMAQTAKEASKAATEASKAAQAAANAATQTEANSDNRGFLSQQWNKWFQKGNARKKDASDESPKSLE